MKTRELRALVARASNYVLVIQVQLTLLSQGSLSTLISERN